MAAPTIASTKPASSATGVSIYPDIEAVFDIPIKFLRHDQSNEPLVFTLKDHTGTTILERKTDDSLPITCVFNDVTRTARLRVFVAMNALKYNETYTASISAAKGLDGTTMTTHSWSFTTEVDPNS